MISIIIPTFNRKYFLEQMIDSILEQTYRDIEIIVIDDCSLDGTEDLIKNKYIDNDNILYYKNNINKGPGFNRKMGFNLSKGEYVIFADDDDFYIDNNFFNTALEIFRKDNSIAFVSGNVNFLYENKKELVEDDIELQNFLEKEIYLNNFQIKWRKPISTFSTIFNKDHLINANINDMRIVNDSSIYLRALLSGNAFILSSHIGVYRVHNNNITKSLNVNFIFDNLKEKKNIYEIIRCKYKNNDNFNNWYNNQVYTTLMYFIKESNLSNRDFIKILKYNKKNNVSICVNLKIILNFFKLKFA